MLVINANINLFLIEVICSSLLASNSSIFVATKKPSFFIFCSKTSRTLASFRTNSPLAFAKFTFASSTPSIFLETFSIAFEQFTQLIPAIFSLTFKGISKLLYNVKSQISHF